jgi:hypothetical protein
MRLALLLALFASPFVAAEPVTHRVLAADQSKGHLAIVEPGGKVSWEFPDRHDVHDLQVLPGGNVLTQTSATNVVEVTPEKAIAWKYEAKQKAGYKGRVEIHSFERLSSGNTLVAESGNCRLVEVDKAGKVVVEVPLSLTHPDAHRDTRRVRKLASGNYLVCHEGIGTVREYDPAGKAVWEYKLDLNGRPASGGHGVEGHGTAVFNALRLPSGNTLIAGGNANRVIEVNAKGEVVWSVEQKELPGITLAWVTGLQVMPNGNVVIGNCHAGPDNPQLIEVTRDKKVVWTFRDFKTFGNSLASAVILDVPGVLR